MKFTSILGLMFIGNAIGTAVAVKAAPTFVEAAFIALVGAVFLLLSKRP